MDEAADNEVFYDTEIAPALKALSEKCAARRIPFIATVEYKKESLGITGCLGENASVAMRLICWAVEAKGNIDLLIMKALRWVGKRPHTSVVLNILQKGQDSFFNSHAQE